MNALPFGKRYLADEARALCTRIDGLHPYSVTMTMAPAAAVPPNALAAIERHIARVRINLRATVEAFLRWINTPEGKAASVEEAQRRFTLLRLRFNTVTSQFDIYADVLVQRSQHGVGVWIAGLDDLAADAIRLPGISFPRPPIVCYLQRGHGAAIRRARSRLPGGDLSPVAVIQIPRERMIGLGIGASLVHEVGHQAAVILDLIEPLKAAIRTKRMSASRADQFAWFCWERWISEVIADFWSVGLLGLPGTLGLFGVLSLPRAFMFTTDVNDPHPGPWIRGLTSCALGARIYPHRKWSELAQMWLTMYPPHRIPPTIRPSLDALRRTLPAFAQLISEHKPAALGGRTLGSVMARHDRRPERLEKLFERLRQSPRQWSRLPPALAFATASLARANGRLSPEGESKLVRHLLTHWAIRSAKESSTFRGSNVLQKAAIQKRESMSQAPG